MSYSWLFNETSIAFIFILILSIVLWRKKEKLAIQKIFYPLLYMILYRTKLGIKGMDRIAAKHPKLIKYFSYTGIYVGFIGMIFIMGTLIYTLIKTIIESVEVPAIMVAQPFVKTEFGSFFFYIPITYFIIAIFIIAVSHEACHGIVARLHKVEIKSSGFAFFSIFIPIIPAAFVEPDEKKVKKLKPMQQLSIFAAGPFANILLAGILILLTLFAINPMLERVSTEEIVIVGFNEFENQTNPVKQAGISLGDKIIRINDVNITDLSSFIEIMSETKPEQTIILKTNSSYENITLLASPDNDYGILGVMVRQQTEFTEDFQEQHGWSIPIIYWLLGLVTILTIFNLGVGLFNLVPIGPLDGGRMVLTLLMTKYKEKKALIIWGKITMITLLILLSTLILPIILRLINRF
ncbi:MAG: site-2 protease family protein [Candidatus Woesearchaeota archaeon]